ncbi:MAG: hypothetical protein H6980_00325 [Gammaproteobacteria bacterium]|nr:hypothetical protein [Gammaproteobacteria bacterium]
MTIRLLPSFLFALFWMGAAVADTASESAERVRATHAALQSASTDFQTEVGAGRLSGAEQEDYRRYIAALTERLRDDCRDFRNVGGDPATLQGQCDIGAPAAPRAAAIDTGAERTRGERISDAEAELRAAMGEFDQTILREQERLRSKDSGGGGGGGGGGSAGGGGREGQAGKQGDGKRAGERDGDRAGDHASDRDGEENDRDSAGGGRDESASGKDQTTGKGSADGRKPDGRRDERGGGGSGGSTKGQGGDKGADGDIPDAGGDDVIARQLREAAENETDPELRAKLWEEYRRYKDEQN